MAKTKRIMKARKVFLDENGNRTNTPTKDSTKLMIEVFDPNQERGEGVVPRVVETVGLNVSDVPEELRNVAMLHGLSQKVGDSYSGTDWADIADTAQDMVERITSGIWNREGEKGGPRITQLFTAVCDVLAEAAGGEITEEQRENVRNALKDDDQRKAMAANPKVAARLAVIRAEAAAEKAAKLAEAAENADNGEDTNTLSAFL